MPTNFDEHGRYRPSVMDDPLILLGRIANHEATIGLYERMIADMVEAGKEVAEEIKLLRWDNTVLVALVGERDATINQLRANVEEYRVENEKLRRLGPERSED